MSALPPPRRRLRGFKDAAHRRLERLPKVPINFMEMDGNAFAIMASFQRAARREDEWTREDIDCVLEDMRAGNYDHLIQTMLRYCELPTDNDDEYYE